MKKGSKPQLVLIILLLLLVACTVLVYVGIKKKCEVATKDKVLAEEEFNSKKNRRISLLAEYQMLISEDRITAIAAAELGMKKRTEPAVEINVDKEKIDRIQKILDEKYE